MKGPLSMVVGGLLACSALASEPVTFCGRPLVAQPVAPNTWMVEGQREELSAQNCGHIGNQAFIVTPNGVIVIDSGSSPAFGDAFKRLIGHYTDAPVRWVFNTHHHPDHFFGNAAFDQAEHLALATTLSLMARDRAALIDNVERLTGRALPRTRLALPRSVAPGAITLDGYPLTLFAMTGHSGGDLVLLDPATKTLFLGDMAFYQRAPATAHTPGLDQWQAELSQLHTLDADIAVPGHGPSATPSAVLDQTAAWLAWLDRRLSDTARAGLGANAALDGAVPERFNDVALDTLALGEYEFTRSVMQLYARYEEALLWGSDND